MYNYLSKNRSNNLTEKEFNKNKEDHLTQSQLLLAKSSELVAGLPSTREWSFIETQRLAG